MPLARFALYERGVEIYLAPTADDSDDWHDSLVTSLASRARSSSPRASFQRASSYPADVPLADGDALIGPRRLGDPRARRRYLAGPLWDEEGILYADSTRRAFYAARQRFDPAGHYHRPDVLSLTVTPTDVTAATVVGAGVFGASTARELDRRGFDVTLLEQYTPGNVRSGSGGDTRLLAPAHGDVEWYSPSARRARELWRELERRPASGSGKRSVSPGSPPRGGFKARAARRSGGSASRTSGCRPTTRVASTRRSAATTSARCSSSRRRACCMRAAPRNCSSRRARPASASSRARVPADEPRGRRRRLGLRLLARRSSFPSSSSRRSRGATSSSSAATAAGAARPGFCDYDGAFYGHGDIGGPRREGRARHAAASRSTPDRLDRLPSAERAAWPRYAAQPLPGARRRADRRRAGLPVRPDDGHALPRSRDIPSAPTGGSSAAARDTASSTARRSPSTSPTASREPGEPEPFHALGPRTGNAGLRTAAARLARRAARRFVVELEHQLPQELVQLRCSGFVSAAATNASLRPCARGREPTPAAPRRSARPRCRAGRPGPAAAGRGRRARAGRSGSSSRRSTARARPRARRASCGGPMR